MALKDQFGGRAAAGTFRFEWDPPIGEIEIGVEAWADMLTDFTEFFDRLVTLTRRHLGKQFDTEGAYTGGTWQALSDGYAAWKEEAFPGRPILVLTGALRKAAVEGGPGSLKRVTPRLMAVGVDSKAIPYARAHQTGGPNLPQREILRITDKFRQVIAQLFHAFVVWARKAAFRKAGRIDDPFLDERFESRMDTIAAYSTGDEAALDAVFEAGKAALGVR